MLMMMMMVMLREEAKGDGSRQKISIVEQKEKIRILSHCLPFSFLLLLWVICMMCSGYTNNAIDAQTLDIMHTRMHTLCVDRDAKDRR